MIVFVCRFYIVVLFFFALSLTDTGVKSELGIYDTLLAIKPEIRERSDILLVNIDDEAIERSMDGSTSVSRSVLVAWPQLKFPHVVPDGLYWKNR